MHAPARETARKICGGRGRPTRSSGEWGWTTPALVGEDGGLIAGHARVLAARQLGIAEIPVMVAAGWSEAQERAYVLADNQLAITGSGWDPEQVGNTELLGQSDLRGDRRGGNPA